KRLKNPPPVRLLRHIYPPSTVVTAAGMDGEQNWRPLNPRSLLTQQTFDKLLQSKTRISESCWKPPQKPTRRANRTVTTVKQRLLACGIIIGNSLCCRCNHPKTTIPNFIAD